MDGKIDRREFYALENYEGVYAHVEQTWQDQEKAERYHALLSKVLKPQIYFGPGVEDRMQQEILLLCKV